MAVSEQTRHALYSHLEEVLGTDDATTLMEQLPRGGWADVATKHDLDALRVATKHDLDALRVATKHDLDALRVATQHDLDALRVDLDALRVSTQHDLDALRVSTKHDLDALGERMGTKFAELELRFERGLRVQTWRLMMLIVAMASVVIAAVRL